MFDGDIISSVSHPYDATVSFGSMAAKCRITMKPSGQIQVTLTTEDNKTCGFFS